MKTISVLLFTGLIALPAVSYAQQKQTPKELTQEEAKIFLDLYSVGDDVNAMASVIATKPDSVSDEFITRLFNSLQHAKLDVISLSRLSATQYATIRPDGFELATAARDDATAEGARIGNRIRETYEASDDAYRTAVGIESRLQIANMHFLERNVLWLYLSGERKFIGATGKPDSKGVLDALEKWLKHEDQNDRVLALRAMADLFSRKDITEFVGENWNFEGAGFENRVAVNKVSALILNRRWSKLRDLYSELHKATGSETLSEANDEFESWRSARDGFRRRVAEHQESGGFYNGTVRTLNVNHYISQVAALTIRDCDKYIDSPSEGSIGQNRRIRQSLARLDLLVEMLPYRVKEK